MSPIAGTAPVHRLTQCWRRRPSSRRERRPAADAAQFNAPYVVDNIGCRKTARPVRRAGTGNVTTGAGLRPGAKATEPPPDPTVGAPVLDSTRFTAADAEVAVFAALWRAIHGAPPPGALRATESAPGGFVNAARVLDVLSSKPARPDSRSPCENIPSLRSKRMPDHLRALPPPSRGLKARIGDKCGLAPVSHRFGAAGGELLRLPA